MTRLEIAARILAGWAANPNVCGTYEASAEVSLALADALLSAAGETAPGDQYEAGFRECQERAAKVCGVEAGLAKEAMDLITASVSIERARHAMRQNTALHLQEMIRALAPAAPMPSDPGAHLHHCPATAMRCSACPTGGPQACEQVPAAPKDAAPGCPDCFGRTRCESCDDAPDEKPAPSLAPVKFDEHQRALLASGDVAQRLRDGWEACTNGKPYLAVYLHLRPGEDAGELTARMLASVGRTL